MLKVGDLAMTHRGNLVLVAEVGKNSIGQILWYNIVFSLSGLLREGYPSNWLRRLTDEESR